MENLKIYNNCKIDLLSGYQLKRKRAEYTVGKSLEATIDVGNKRNKQQDAVLILEHPYDKNNKILAVADGVGENNQSEEASKFLLEELAYYFETKDKLDKTNPLQRIYEYKKILNQINNLIIEKEKGQTTLSLALYNPKETIILNIGDSRIYTYKGDKLYQETRDDSFVQELYEKGKIPSENLKRFFKYSNVISNALGVKNFKTSSKLILNNYDVLLALTDGITDCLSNEELEEIVKRFKKYHLSTFLVEFALHNNSYNDMIKDELYLDVIPGGKDNTTAAVLKLK